jgi:hypothetical protein
MYPYSDLLTRYATTAHTLRNLGERLAMGRLATAIAALICLYFGAKTGLLLVWVLFVAATVAFGLLVRKSQRNQQALELAKALETVNRHELDFVTGKNTPFYDGQNEAPVQHDYAHDLDFFGPNSLFQHLNRTGTFFGKKTLAAFLNNVLNDSVVIRQRQRAVQELSAKLDFRQHLQARAALRPDKDRTATQLLQWAERPAPQLSPLAVLVSWVLPILLAVLVAVGWVTGQTIYLTVASVVFSLNLAAFGLFFKKITAEIAEFDQIHLQLLQYSQMIAHIEDETFETPMMRDLAITFVQDQGHKASDALRQLSQRFAYLDSLANFLVVLLFDGTFQYHVHQLRYLRDWKLRHGAHIPEWLSALGQVEALSSLANFAHNNPHYAFPDIGEKNPIELEELGHPLVPEGKRVCNSVSFEQRRFIVLTGSNMSGKSTFLRSLGVNMVLACTGAPVCARRAVVRPMPVLVSMRLADSLADSTSYFYAEVKRLGDMVAFLQKQPAFVLLDEILRGTNSDDKRAGTVGVLRKMVQLQATGAMATHDVEVCRTTDEYPDVLTNKCFEVQIRDNAELHFDYRLLDGVCQNRSASFLMGKMGIIG